MTTYDKASLVMIPSGYKDDKLYSIKPTDGSGDFTFSRDGAGASPATRVNASGLIEKGRENVLLQSNQFDTTWANASSTDTGGQADKDGGTDAWLLEKSAVNGRIQQLIVSSGVQTYSVYAKAGTSDWMSLMITTATGDRVAFFDLSNGVVGTGFNLIDKNIESVGGGWYRCSITFNETSITARIYVSDADNDNSGTTGNIYIQDAQLEQGLVATDYIETTTAAVSAGLLGDMPRLDYHNPDSPTPNSCPSLLLEPSRVNVLPQSEYLNASVWTKTRCTIDDNTDETLSPEGVYNASKMVSTDASESYVQDEGTISGTKANLSFFAKKGDLDFVHGLVWDNSANGCRQWFNVNTGAVGGTTTFGSGYSVVSGSEKIESFGNGWYRCSFTANVTTGVNAFRANLSSADTTLTSPVNSYGYFYGVQAEDASYPTSYIPTYGSASTRGGDSCVKTGISSLIGQTEGTLYAELNWKAETGAEDMAIWMRFGATSYNEMIALYIGNNFKAQASVRSSAIQQVILASDVLSDGIIKMAFAYKNNDFAFYVNGTLVGTDTNGSVPTCDQIYLGGYPDGGVRRGNNKQILVFKTRLTNAELAALTA